MTVKEYLSRPKELKEEIRCDLDNLAAMRSIVENCTAHLSFTAGRNPSKNKDAFEDVMIAITEEEERISGKVRDLAKLEMKILREIRALKNRDQEAVLRMRYLEDLPWDAIQRKAGIGKTQIFVVHQDALANFKISDSSGHV